MIQLKEQTLPVKIEIIAIGTELLRGSTVNTNAGFISKTLLKEGYETSYHISLPDDCSVCEKAIKEATLRADLIITTGGLGPTLDDRTEEILKAVFLKEPQRIPNKIGSAPALVYSTKKGLLIALPGVPKEVEGLFFAVMDLIKKAFPMQKKGLFTEWSLGEKTELDVDQTLRKIQEKQPDMQIGIYPSLGTLRICLSSFKERAEAEKSMDVSKEILEELYGTYVFSKNQESLEEALQKTFKEKGLKLAIAESCTGGAIAEALTQIPGASKYLFGSIVAYSNACKMQFLSIDPKDLELYGAVSKEVALAMATSLKKISQVDYTIAVSGIAGPSGGTEKKPVGTVAVAIVGPDGVIASGYLSIRKNRPSIIEYTKNRVLFALWRWMNHKIRPNFHELPVS